MTVWQFHKAFWRSTRGGRLTSLDASFMRCFGFFQTSSKTSRSMFFSKHRWNIASLSKKCDVLRDVLGLGPQRQKWLGPTIFMPLWYNFACHASIFVNKLLEKTHCCHNLSQISKNLLQFFNSFKIVNKNIANMHREQDVSAFFEHRQKHRGRCFFQNIA